MLVPRILKCKSNPKLAFLFEPKAKKKRKVHEIATQSKELIVGKQTKRPSFSNERWRQFFIENRSAQASLLTDDIKQSSREQRIAEEGEPVCIICSKYGEYICDQTEADVCSKECKNLNLININVARSKVLRKKEDDTWRQAQGIELCKLWLNDREQNGSPLSAELSKSCESGQSAELPSPITSTFRQSDLIHSVIVENLENMGLHSPTPVQAQGIPCGITSEDFICVAPHGTGKTIAYLLVAFVRTLPCRYVYPENALILILAPTRQLCLQVENEGKQLVKGVLQMRTASIVGGLPAPPQVYRLKKGVQLVVATPGRLTDFLSKDPSLARQLLEQIMIVVVDEADVMFSKGFKKQFKKIAAKVSEVAQKRPQWMFFSSTPCKEAEQFCVRSDTIQRHPFSATEASREFAGFVLKFSTPHPSSKVEEKIMWVEDTEKVQLLLKILMNTKKYQTPAIIFVARRLGCELLAGALMKTPRANLSGIVSKTKIAEKSWKCVQLHGEMDHHARQEAIQDFESGRAQIMVATDVAGVGLDFKHINTILNFDMPDNIRDYHNRAGRLQSVTEKKPALGGKLALSFINKSNSAVFQDLIYHWSQNAIYVPDFILDSMKKAIQEEKASKTKKIIKSTSLSDKDIDDRIQKKFSLEAVNQWNLKGKHLSGKAKLFNYNSPRPTITK